MEATTLAWIWYFLPSILNAIKPTSSASVNYDYFRRNSIDSYEPTAFDNNRFYRQAMTSETTDLHPTDQTVSNSPYEINIKSQNGDFLESNKQLDESKLVIPLNSFYSPESQTDKKVDSPVSTFGYTKPHMLSKGDLAITNINSDQNNSTEPTHISKGTIDYIGLTSTTNEALESTSPMTQLLTSTERDNINLSPTKHLVKTEHSSTPVEVDKVTLDPKDENLNDTLRQVATESTQIIDATPVSLTEHLSPPTEVQLDDWSTPVESGSTYRTPSSQVMQFDRSIPSGVESDHIESDRVSVDNLPKASDSWLTPTEIESGNVEPAEETTTFDDAKTAKEKINFTVKPPKAPLDHWLTRTETERDKVKHDKGLEVIGLGNKTKTDDSYLEMLTDRIIVLQPFNQGKYVWEMQTVHDSAKNVMLKKETEDYLIRSNTRFNELPLVEKDNFSWKRYSRAVVESFVLDFCRNYPHYTELEEGGLEAEDYHRYYNTTLLNFQKKKKSTALQFAAPVKRVADIYNSILDTPIGIVQSKCQSKAPRWLCFAQYLVNLAEESENCECIWYHAQVHLTLLETRRNEKGGKDSADAILSEVNSRLPTLNRYNDVDYLFDFIIQTLHDLRDRLRESLLAKADFHNLIRRLQKENKLRCLNVDNESL